jgi:hypothetical protein
VISCGFGATAMRKVNSLADVQIIFNDLLNERDRKNNSDWNRNGYQIKNMGDGVDPQDAVTVEQLDDAIAKVQVATATPAPTQPPAPSFVDSYKKAYL